MPTRQSSAVQAYVRLVRASEALHSEVSRGLMIEGLTASQFSTMKVLRIHGSLSQRDIAKYILKSGGNITVLVDNLEREGLAIRERDTTDRRIVYVRLTPAGEEMFDRIYPGHLERIHEAMSPLTPAECEQLVMLLQKVSAENVDIACAPSVPIAATRS